ncbi:hypothetical protein [Streptomyces californicus]|uniref:hypothetical protein n=1 Tax=Streptomyces californicus TaxID=67351 RepID=UPI0033E64A5E
MASLLALAQVLPNARPFTVTAAGQERRMWLLFTGNGVYEPAGLIPPCGGLYSTRACSTCARSAPTTGSPALA